MNEIMMKNEPTFITVLEKEFDKNPNELEVWLRLLLPLERETFDILYKAAYPLSAKGVVDELVNVLWNDVKKAWVETMGEHSDDACFNHNFVVNTMKLELQGAKNEKEARKIKDKYIAFGSSGGLIFASKPLTVTLWKDRHFPGQVETELTAVRDIVVCIDYSKPPYQIIDQKRTNLIKNKLVSIPDPRKIERILSALEVLGIVVSRELTDEKAKKVYALNPKAQVIFKQLFKA